MKYNTISSTSHSDVPFSGQLNDHRNLLNHRWVKSCALTLSCLAAIPSFAQPLNCNNPYFDDGVWVCPQILPGGGSAPWQSPNPNGSGTNPGGNNSGGGCWVGDPGCHSDDDGQDNSQSCSAFRGAQLRQIKQQTPQCYGDPGPNFDVEAWQQDETSGIWNWLTEPIGGVWHDAIPALHVLAHQLEHNGSDMIAAYPAFESKLWITCQQEYPYYSHFDEQEECLRDSYYLLDNYYPGIALSAYIVNWFFGSDLVQWTMTRRGAVDFRVI